VASHLFIALAVRQTEVLQKLFVKSANAKHQDCVTMKQSNCGTGGQKMANEKLDLIDRNELLPNGVFYVNGDNPMTSIDELLNRIANAKNVDAVEVVHGQWVMGEKGKTYCGRCRVIDDYASVHNYCPFCGAKMDLED
jgi:NADH pyrophosphatase NudC (nudix superfamily)